MIYQRGQQKDYNTWQELSGSDGWGWDDMSTYFDKSLDYDLSLANGTENGISFENDETDWNNVQGGEWHVEKQRLSWAVLDDFRQACEDSNIPIRAHFNSSDQEGCGYFQVNQKSGFRLSSHGAFLKPILHRENITVETNQHVEKITIEKEEGDTNSKPRATGIVLTDTKSGTTRTVHAHQEIILSAGAVGSPHILQCSGVGNPKTLQQYNIPKPSTTTNKGELEMEDYVALEGVGENLQDHLQIRSVYKLKDDTLTLNSWKKAGSLIGQAMMGLEYAMFQTGELSMAPSQFGLFANSERSGGTPDLQFHIQPLSLDDLSNPQSMHDFPGKVVHIKANSIVFISSFLFDCFLYTSTPFQINLIKRMECAHKCSSQLLLE